MWLKGKLKEMKINISRVCQDTLIRVVKEKNPEFVPPREPFIIVTHCPFCGGHQQCSTVYIVRCKYCGKRYRVYTKRYGLRGKFGTGKQAAEIAIRKMNGD